MQDIRHLHAQVSWQLVLLVEQQHSMGALPRYVQGQQWRAILQLARQLQGCLVLVMELRTGYKVGRESKVVV